MEPERLAPNIGPERPAVTGEQSRELSTDGLSHETQMGQHHERMEHRGESSPQVTNPTPVLPPPLVVDLHSVPPAVPDDVALDDTPLTAADEDLIEKEWVDKAKKIILQTKNDPYRREQEVNRLQADYLRKRYGKELGESQ